MHHAYVFFFELSKQTSQKQRYLQCFDKTKCKEQDVFKQFSQSFSSCFLDSRNQSFLVAVFFHRSSRLKHVLNRKKLPNWTKKLTFAQFFMNDIFFA